MREFKFIVFLIFFHGAYSVLPQQKPDAVLFEEGVQDIDPESLSERVKANKRLYHTDLDKAFRESHALLEEAVQKKAFNEELSLMAGWCFYYNKVIDIENLLISANKLEAKAKSYGNLPVQAKAHIFLSQAYIHNRLFDKGIHELETAKKLLDKGDPNDDNITKAKSDVYTYGSNLYFELKKPEEAAKQLLLAAGEIVKIKNPDEKRIFQYVNFSNLGHAYADLDIDSAEYFVNRSLALDNSGFESSIQAYLNAITLGYVYLKREQYQRAIHHFSEAEKLQPAGGDLLNMIDVYEGLAQAYEKDGQPEKADTYKQQIKDVRLQYSENKNQSLHQVIRQSSQEEKRIKTGYYILWFVAVLFLSALFIIIIIYILNRKKNKKLILQQKKNQEYLEDKLSVISNEIYNEKNLVKMARDRDQAFMATFNKAFPEFSEKILNINPAIVQTELEFMALIRLNLSTKEISQIQNVMPKSVQMKKRRIRKRLNIPQDTDIYYFFNHI